MLSQGNGVPVMTARHELNHQVKTRFVDAVFANDWDTLATLVHPDFELREPAALPYGGVYKGLEGFKACWALIPESSHATEHLNTLACYFTENPDSLIVELDFRGRKKGTDELFASKVMEQFDFKDGKVLAITLYWYNIPRFD